LFHSVGAAWEPIASGLNLILLSATVSLRSIRPYCWTGYVRGPAVPGSSSDAPDNGLDGASDCQSAVHPGERGERAYAGRIDRPAGHDPGMLCGSAREPEHVLGTRSLAGSISRRGARRGSGVRRPNGQRSHTRSHWLAPRFHAQSHKINLAVRAAIGAAAPTWAVGSPTSC
jgi:hypothetical protein